MALLPLLDVVGLLGEPQAPKRAPWTAHGIRLNVADPGWDEDEDWIERWALPDGIKQLY